MFYPLIMIFGTGAVIGYIIGTGKLLEILKGIVGN